jgi:hypothetical protein
MTSMFGGCLVLRDNDWSACSIDGIEAQWQRLTQQSPRGFSAVSAGRHQILTTVNGRPAPLDVTLYPGETLVRRLDATEAKWVLDDRDTERQFMELAQGGRYGAMASALVDYSKVRQQLTGSPPVPAQDEKIQEVCATYLDLAKQLVSGAQLDKLFPAAYQAGTGLIGLALMGSDINKIAGVIGSTASRRAASADFEGAARLCILGLSVLPGDPSLLDLLANLYSDSGRPDLGMELIEEAIRRAHVLPARAQELLKSSYAEISEAAKAKAGP